MSHIAHHFLCKDEVHFNQEEHAIWMLLLTQLKQNLVEFHAQIHPDYFDGFKNLAFTVNNIPDIQWLNQQLASIGWTACFVRGFVPAKYYVQLLANCIFPISSHIRKKSFIKHSPSPDFIHDILGHLPMLFCPQYRHFIQRWAKAATQTPVMLLDELLFEHNDALIKIKESPLATDVGIIKAETKLLQIQQQLQTSPTPLSQLTKLYVWSNEYGLLKTKDTLAIFGAAIMSSSDEIEAIVKGHTTIVTLDWSTIENDVDYTSVQRTLYAADSFTLYEHLLDKLTANSAIQNDQVKVSATTR